MRMLRTYRTAILIASYQAIAALVLAIASALLVITSAGDASLLNAAERPLSDSTSLWLDMLYRLTAADLAVALVLIAFSTDAILFSAEEIRRAVHALNPKTPRTTLERIAALCVGSALACVVGLFFPPARLLDLAKRNDLWSSLILLWPTALTVVLAFFLAVLIGSLEVKRRASR